MRLLDFNIQPNEGEVLPEVLTALDCICAGWQGRLLNTYALTLYHCQVPKRQVSKQKNYQIAGQRYQMDSQK